MRGAQVSYVEVSNLQRNWGLASFFDYNETKKGVPLMDLTPISVRTLRIGVLVNASSGGYEPGFENELEAVLEEMGCRAVKVWCVGGEAVNTALHEAQSLQLAILIVLGGDGTHRAAAEMCSTAGPYLVPLPGGTMNRLPKALYGALGWQDALRATLAAPTVQRIGGGRIGEKPFFVSAIIGNASLFAEAREALRDGDIGEAFREGLEAIGKTFEGSLHYAFASQSGQAQVVYVRCPLRALDLKPDGVAFRVAAITRDGALDALMLALRKIVPGAAANQMIRNDNVRHVEVRSDEAIPAVLDGETVDLGRVAIIDFVQVAFNALVPPHTA